MTQDETVRAQEEAVRERTVARFLECEAKRAEARAAALAEGKPADAAYKIAHEAAKRHWNAWAEDMLAKRKALEGTGVWSATKDNRGALEPKNAETRAWIDESAASFAWCAFLRKEREGTQEEQGDSKEELQAGSLSVKSIETRGNVADFRRFVFPGRTSFTNATFQDDARFDNTGFEGNAYFSNAIFRRDARLSEAAFKAGAWFDRATFEYAWNVSAGLAPISWRGSVLGSV